LIDTHCHLLPDLDDGPRNFREALTLAQTLVATGFRTVVCTPHFSRRYPTDRAVARARLELLASALGRAKRPLRLILAFEVASAMSLEASPEELRRRRLGERHVLVELESDTSARIVELVMTRLTGIGLVPIFAHPERCRAVRARPAVLDAVRDEGALVQVVASSLAGRWSGETENAAWSLLDAERVDLLATDAHRVQHAGDRLRRVLESIAARFGENRLIDLTQTNPGRLLPDPTEAR
jgi:protein-tyrosine phosphatase